MAVWTCTFVLVFCAVSVICTNRYCGTSYHGYNKLCTSFINPSIQHRIHPGGVPGVVIETAQEDHTGASLSAIATTTHTQGQSSCSTKVPAPDWLYKVLDDYSTNRFHIEYNTNRLPLSNHAAHGIIALWRLGANESRVRDFAKGYAGKLEPSIRDDLGDVTDAELLLGKRKNYNDLVRLYHTRLKHYCGDLHTLVQKEFPQLSAGLHNVALHGFIHLGYGLSVQSEQLVCEGLAYLHHSYVPVGRVKDAQGPNLHTLGQGRQNILDVLEAVRNNTHLKKSVLRESTGPESRRMTTFQNKVGAMLDFHSEEVFRFAHSIKFPDFWDPENLSQDQVKRITEWVLDGAVTIYVKSRKKNDFFILHGVTGSWSLCHILPLLSQKEEILQTLRVFLSTLISAYLAQGSPILDGDEEIERDFPQIIKETIMKKRDEHIYKLVHVCYEHYRTNNITKELHLKAAHMALKYDLTF